MIADMAGRIAKTIGAMASQNKSAIDAKRISPFYLYRVAVVTQRDVSEAKKVRLFVSSSSDNDSSLQQPAEFPHPTTTPFFFPLACVESFLNA